MPDSIERLEKNPRRRYVRRVGRQFQTDCVQKGDKRRCGQASWPEGELVGETDTVVTSGVPDRCRT